MKPEKLSVIKLYKSAAKYISTHPLAFCFLTVFYFLGGLLPMIIGITFFELLIIPYYYLFFYFAAGFYYKQQLLLNRKIFIAAGLRFITVALIFLAALLLSTFGINLILNFIKSAVIGGSTIVYLILNSLIWKICKYLFIFVIFIWFFIIPSFAFISEITGKNRSFLTTYLKTKSSYIRIAVTAVIAFIAMLLTIVIGSFLNNSSITAELLRDMVLVFISITYFKMYDFFYASPTPSSETKEDTKTNEEVTEEKKSLKKKKVSSLTKKVSTSKGVSDVN